MFTIRFDMRSPAIGAPTPELYAAALEMAAYVEAHGCASALVLEHHMSPDGYLPSPLILASAIAARTTVLPIMVSVVLLPLYDPVRLAEEMAVLDNLSRGRVAYTAAIGYRPVEYEMYGVDYHRRGRIAEEKLGLLLKAKTGEPFEHEGRLIHVTPAPFTPGGPFLAWGGNSVPAAQRAGRHGLALFAVAGGDAVRDAYEQAARDAGHEPGICEVGSPEMATTVFVADDVDRAWDELGAYLVHDAVSYGEWNVGREVASISFATNVDDLRAENRSHRVMTPEEAVEFIRSGNVLQLHPLVGGVPPELAWPYLRTVVDAVLPALA